MESSENGFTGRRSLRIQKMENKVSYAETSISLKTEKRQQKEVSVVSKKKKLSNGDVSSSRTVAVSKKVAFSVSADVSAVSAAGSILNGDSDGDAAGDGNAHALVTETLRKFNKLYLHFIQEEETRCGKLEAERKAKLEASKKMGSKEEENGCAKLETDKQKSSEEEENGCAKLETDQQKSSEVEGNTEDQSKKPSRRPDLKAITQMRTDKSTLYPEKRIGPIPGIDVGHQFFSRAEMVVVGFHSHWLNGIDYIGATNASKKAASKDEIKSFPVTTSIVVSGQYEDDLDNYDEIIYTGQGGNDLLGNKRQIADQVMLRGNLGLENSMKQNIPVRVVRGRKCTNSYVGKIYTYDGLYNVTANWPEKGVSGYRVYKFRLKRIEGQPPLTIAEQVQFERGRVQNLSSAIGGLVCADISGGLEENPIPVTNLVDNPPVAVEGYNYITELKFSKNVAPPSVPSIGCKCQGQCLDPGICSCARINGGDFPYVLKNGGRLVEPRGIIFECGPHCGCGPECVNRISQRSPKYRLEVFRTPNKGWGVRSWDYIPSGAPVCDYIGLVRRTEDLDPTGENSFVFDIDCLQTIKGMDGRESRLKDVSLPPYLQKLAEEASESVPFCIDAANTGNVTKFINHSCQPNLFVQSVLSDHHDMKLARITLVAADNIPPLKELTYDYGYALDSVVGPDGNIQQLACYCGAELCRKRLY